MRLLKKTTHIVALSAIICAWSFLFVCSANAQNSGNLSVIFTPNPLFKEANFLPGSNVSGLAQVSNNSGAEKPIAVEAINITNDVVDSSTGELFGDALNLVIKKNSTEYFNGTLTGFFNAGEFYLSNLGNGASATYNFTITFNETAENKYQGKNLNFDILIGFQGEAGGGGTTGGGGGGGVRGLSIFSEASTNITDTTATIEWTTSYFSTSRVVYCRQDQNCIFDFSAPPLYGYLSTTAEYDTPASSNGVTHHKVVITGLLANTTYYYRTISHASPPTISREYSFTTLLAQLPKERNDSEDAINKVEVADEELDAPHDAAETKTSFEIRGTETPSAKSDVARPSTESLDDAPLVKGASLDLEEENTNEISDGGNKKTEENNKENITEDAPQEIIKSNIKEWLFWTLLFIIAIELYILISKRKKKEEKKEEDGEKKDEKDIN